MVKLIVLLFFDLLKILQLLLKFSNFWLILPVLICKLFALRMRENAWFLFKLGSFLTKYLLQTLNKIVILDQLLLHSLNFLDYFLIHDISSWRRSLSYSRTIHINIVNNWILRNRTIKSIRIKWLIIWMLEVRILRINIIGEWMLFVLILCFNFFLLDFRLLICRFRVLACLDIVIDFSFLLIEWSNLG